MQETSHNGTRHRRTISALRCLALSAAALLLLISATGCRVNKDVILATTTSLQDSGLLEVLVPLFEKQTGYRVKTIAVGSGQALALAQRGEADVLFSHAPEDEKALVDQGILSNRHLVMYNDFVIVGPGDDPADVRHASSASDAFARIARGRFAFVSRGDSSGTHKKEMQLWAKAGISPRPGDTWYIESGLGMGQTLILASQSRAYTLTDRATYGVMAPNINLAILYQGDEALLNVYHVMQPNPDRFPKINKRGAQAFIAFMVSPQVQELIGQFKKETYGTPLFFPAAQTKK